MCEKRDQIPNCDLPLFDSEEEEKEGRGWEKGKERKEDKGTSEGCRQWLSEGGSIILSDICFL